MTLTDREKALVELLEAARNVRGQFEGRAMDEGDALVLRIFFNALRAYDPPKPKDTCEEYCRSLLERGFIAEDVVKSIYRLAQEIDAIKAAKDSE